MPDSQQPDRTRKRIYDLAKIAPLLVLLLLSPPVITLFATDTTIFGAPLILIYLAAVWLGAIFAAALLARAVGRDEADPPTP